MENFLENYVHHRDVLVHKTRIRFHISLFMLPIFLVLLVELIILAGNRSFFPVAHNTYVDETQTYLSPLASPSVGQIQVGIGGAPPSSSSSQHTN